MPAVGGSIQELEINGRVFPFVADGGVNRHRGGYNNENPANGNGTTRLIKTATGWRLENCQVEVDDARGDQAFLQGIADGLGYVPCAITYASGFTDNGDGIPEEVVYDSQTASATFTLSGTGELTQQ